MQEDSNVDTLLTLGRRLHFHITHQPSFLIGKISRIEPDFLCVAMDLPEHPLWLPQNGQTLEVRMAASQGVYRFSSIYQTQQEEHWFITKPTNLARQQHRRYVRVSAPLPLQFKTTNRFGGLNNAKESVALDISGNGISFVSDQEIEPNSRVFLNITDLPALGSFKTYADTIRCTPVSVPQGRIFHIGVCMEKYLSTSLQDKLIHCIFHLQRNHLEKGLGRQLA